MVYFRVPDIHAVHRTLAERGVTFGSNPQMIHRAGGTELWLAEFRDPDGNQLALMSEVPVGGDPAT
jgi:predicted enzyme related to lactoylglutathione lyase